MSVGKPIGPSPEQIQWVNDQINAQVYGEPISDEALGRILEAVGPEHVPSDLDLGQLKTDIYTAWRLYKDIALGTSKGERSRMRTYIKKVQEAAHELAAILGQQNLEAKIFRHSRLSSELFSLNGFRIQLAWFPKLIATFESTYSEKATVQARAALGLTAKEFLFGLWLPKTFEKHFKQKADRSRQSGGSVDSPYIRFAIAFSESHGWKKLSPETVSAAVTKAKTWRGKSTKNVLKDWHLDGQGIKSRALGNF